MAEVATANNIIQLGVESTPGAEAAVVTKQMRSFDITPGIKFTGKPVRPLGRKFPTTVVPGKEWLECKITGNPTYGELPYLLCGGVADVTPTTEGTLCKVWTHAPALSDADDVATYVVEQGSAAGARKWRYGLINELGFKFSRDGLELTGTMLGQAIIENAGLTTTGVTVSDGAPIPIAGDDVKVVLADTWSGLAAASVTAKVLTAEWKISERFAPLWYLDASKPSFAGHVEKAPKCQVKLLVEADANGMALLANMRAGSNKIVRIQCAGPDIETDKPYLFQIDSCCAVTTPSEYKDQDGVYALEWTLDVVCDPTTQKTVELTVRNKLASL